MARHPLTISGAPATHLMAVRTAQSGEHQTCAVVVGKIPKLLHTDCGRDGILLMTKINRLETL